MIVMGFPALSKTKMVMIIYSTMTRMMMVFQIILILMMMGMVLLHVKKSRLIPKEIYLSLTLTETVLPII